MKNILIDLTQIPLERTGVGIYAVNYVSRLREQRGRFRLHFLILDDDAELLELARAVPDVTVMTLPARIFRRFVSRVLLEQVGIPAIAMAKKIDLVHSLHYSFPLLSFGRFRRVVTVCDMSFLLFPELHILVKRVFFGFFIRRLPGIEGLLFISASTMHDFGKYFPASKAASAVVPLGTNLDHWRREPDAGLVTALKQRFGIDRYILYVGALEPRKNILGLVKAFERCADIDPDLKLVIAGKLGWNYDDLLQYVRESALGERIVLTGYINEAEKHALLKSAQLFAYVSLYEGFGLPVLEGMAAGVPTVTSNISSMPEVAGQGALQIDPQEVGQIADALKDLILDENVRRQWRERGLEQSRAFTWENMTRGWLDFYQHVLDRAAQPAHLPHHDQ
ncbi:MAG TPA: glycosyltransferase family 1 protein [Noviherbaspirillum sp.]